MSVSERGSTAVPPNEHPTLTEHPNLSSTEFTSAVTALTSAFGDPTRRAIYLYARDTDEGVTASQTAAHFELHPNVARHHLDKLATGGYLEVRLARSGSGAGRPSKRYRVGAEAVPLTLPVRADDILVRLLGKALQALGPTAATAVAEEVGREVGATLAGQLDGRVGVGGSATGGGSTDGSHDGHGAADRHPGVGPGTIPSPASVRSALHAVAGALSAHGFGARAQEQLDGSSTIVTDHCPFGDTPVDNPVVCAVDRGMVQGMLSALLGSGSADHTSTRARGDDVCVTAVTL